MTSKSSPFNSLRHYLVSQQVFGHPLGAHSIRRFVSYIDKLNGLITLSKVAWAIDSKGALDTKTQLYLVDQLIDKTRRDAVKSYLSSNPGILFFRAQIHTLMKYVARYGQDNDPPKPVGEIELVKLGNALLAVTDLIADESGRIRNSLSGENRLTSITLQIVTGSPLIKPQNLIHSLIRSKLLFVDVHAELGVEPPPDYLDIDSIFGDISGISLSHFLEIGLVLSVYFQKYILSKAILPPNEDFIFLNKERFFEQTIVSDDIVEKFFTLLSTTVPQFSSQFDENDKRGLAFDFLYLMGKPLIEINQGSYIPFSYDFLSEKVSTGLYWIIFDHLMRFGETNDHLKFSRYNGDLYERYVQNLCDEIHKRSKDNEEICYSDEPFYIGKVLHKTPDVLIIRKDSIIAIEATAGRITAKRTLAEGLSNAFEDDCKKIIYKKANELDRFITRLRGGKVVIDGMKIDGSKRVYPVIIAIEGFPKLRIIDDYVSRELKSQDVFSQGDVAPVSILDTVDLENIAIVKDLHLQDALSSWQSDKNFPYISLSEHLFTKWTDDDFPGQSEWFTTLRNNVLDEATISVFGKPLLELDSGNH